MSSSQQALGENRFAPLFPLPAIVVALIAFAAILPMLFLGTPSGHDFEFHLDSWMEVVGQWRQGILYPRWAEFAHYGYGEARFLFYPPASWILGALLGLVLPWKLVPGVVSWVALTSAGGAMFVLARRWLPASGAMFAAALYAVNPYHLVIVYWRSDFAELLASTLMPLLLLLILRVPENRRVILPLALLVAATWLTNAPSAVMINYSLALLVLVVAILRRSPGSILCGAIAVTVGLALAAYYVVPAAYEEKWVNIAEVLSPGVRPQDNFLFSTTNDPDHNRFNLLVSIVAAAEALVVAASALLTRKLRHTRPELWWTLIAWSAASILLMVSFTFVLWEHLPQLRFVQLPWRLLLCLNVSLAMLVALGWRRWIARLAACAAMLAVVIAVWVKVQPPWWDHASDIAEIHDNIRHGNGYEGTDEYVPAGADPYEIKQGAPKVLVEGAKDVRLHIQNWGPESKIISTELTGPGKLVLRLFNYPAWKAEVNGRPTPTETADVTGQVIVPVPGGGDLVKIVFTRTWDRTVGGVISLLTLILMIGAAWRWRPRTS